MAVLKTIGTFLLLTICLNFIANNNASAQNTSVYDFTPVVVKTYTDGAIIKATRVPTESEAYRVHCTVPNFNNILTDRALTSAERDTLRFDVSGLPTGQTTRCKIMIVEYKMLTSIDDDYSTLGESNSFDIQTTSIGETLAEGESLPSGFSITIKQGYGFIPYVLFVNGDTAALRASDYPLEKDEKYGYSCEQVTQGEGFSEVLKGENEALMNKTTVIRNLKRNTQYYCIMTVSSLSDKKFQGISNAVSFMTTDTYTSIPYVSYEEPILPEDSTYTTPFPDVQKQSIEAMASRELYRRDVIKGYEDGAFKGGRSVNRAELAKFLLVTVNKQLDTDLPTFADLSKNAWYVPYITTAQRYGYMSGYPDGTFRPDQTVNTAEFLKLLTLTFLLEKNLSYSYKDVEQGSWYAQYAGIAEKYNLFPYRTYGELLPGSFLTRNEVAVAIYQYLKNR